MRRLLLIICLFPALAYAQNEPEPGMQLEVKPVLCVTDKRNPICDVTFLVIWKSVTTDYYCVFNDLADGPLTCWEDADSGRTVDDRKVEESFTFWMTGRDLEERLAEVAVEVLRLNSEDRRRRRRSKHVWDIN